MDTSNSRDFMNPLFKKAALIVACTKVKICSPLLHQHWNFADLQNQKNLLVLALYCNIRRTLGIKYKRSKYYKLTEMHAESTICNISNNNLTALVSNRIKRPFKLSVHF